MNQLVLRYPVGTLRRLRAALVAFDKICEWLAAWSTRRRARASLLSLSDGELQDIGISHAQALYEFDKSWRG